jgi:protein transport protein SEC24
MAVTRNIGFEALLRVRCSTGLRAATFEGNIVLSGNNDVELAAVDSSRTLLCGMLYDNSFPAGSSFAYIQTALLYTTRFGERLVRVFNLRLPVVTTLFNVFKGADLDCIMNYYLRCAAKELKKNAEVKEKKEKILYHCAELLSVYRKNCASNKPSAQLILPDSLKLFPVYTCSLWKNELLRAGHVKSDRRAFLIHEVLSMPVELSIPFIYPTLVCLLDDFPEGSISPALACTAESIKPDSAYLFENGFEMFLFIGPQCPSSFYLEVFGFDNPKAINFDLSDIPVLENQLNKKLRNLVDLLRHRRRRYMSLTIATAASKNENLLQYYLVEDKGENSRSYHDTLRYIHSKIRALLQ